MRFGECLYFGCWGSTGHHMWTQERESLGGWDDIASEFPFVWHKLDGGFIDESCKWKEGHATLTNVDGWTVLSFPDNSVDTRSSSNSGYAIKGEFDFNEAVCIAKSYFPDVWERYNFEVVDALNQQ